jgi:hypothetical protein
MTDDPSQDLPEGITQDEQTGTFTVDRWGSTFELTQDGTWLRNGERVDAGVSSELDAALGPNSAKILQAGREAQARAAHTSHMRQLLASAPPPEVLREIGREARRRARLLEEQQRRQTKKKRRAQRDARRKGRGR